MAAPPEIDFAALHRRLDRAEAETSAAATRSPEQRRAILESRASAVAGAKQSSAEATVPVFAFEVAGDRYALGLDEVVLVLEIGGLSPIPGAPPWLLGALAARSQIVPVVDPRQLLQVAREGLFDLRFVVVVQHRSEAVGIAVESLVGQLDVPDQELAHASTGPFRWTTSDGLARVDLERFLSRASEP